MVQNPDTARAICDEAILQTGKALLTRDFSLFLKSFAIPHTVETFEGAYEITSLEKMRDHFDGVCDYYSQTGVTEMVRTCLEARFRDEDTVVATHESRLLRGTEIVRKPYPTLSIFHRMEEGWKAVSTQYAITDSTDHIDALLGRYHADGDARLERSD